MDGNYDSKFVGVTVMTCAEECYKKISCVAFEYWEGGRTCYTSSRCNATEIVRLVNEEPEKLGDLSVHTWAFDAAFFASQKQFSFDSGHYDYRFFARVRDCGDDEPAASGIPSIWMRAPTT